MYNCIVETKGEFGLLNSNGDDIRHNRPTLTLQTTFIEQRLLRGDIRVLARNLPRTSTDAEFEQVLKDSKDDVKLAVAAFCGLYNQDVGGDKFEDDAEVESEEAKAARLADEATKEKEAAEDKEEKRKAKEAAKEAAKAKEAEDKAAADAEAAKAKEAEEAAKANPPAPAETKPEDNKPLAQIAGFKPLNPEHKG